jgi:hypothetical protein
MITFKRIIFEGLWGTKLGNLPNEFQKMMKFSKIRALYFLFPHTTKAEIKKRIKLHYSVFP